jgi:hypothetical protein
MLQRRKPLLFALTAGLLFAAAAVYAEREFRVYRSFEEQADDVELPPDWNRPAGFVIARLMYPSAFRGFGRFGGFGGDWRQGGTTWAVDYPRGDRYYAGILRRLTNIDVRSVEQPVNLEDGDDASTGLISSSACQVLTDDTRKAARNTRWRLSVLRQLRQRPVGNFAAGLRCAFPDQRSRPAGQPPAVPRGGDVTRKAVPNMNALMGGGRGYLGDGACRTGAALLMTRPRDGRSRSQRRVIVPVGRLPGLPGRRRVTGPRIGVNFAVCADALMSSQPDDRTASTNFHTRFKTRSLHTAAVTGKVKANVSNPRTPYGWVTG